MLTISALAVSALPLEAQSSAGLTAARDDVLPDWSLRWSPLAPGSRDTRTLVPRVPLPDLLGAPAPRVGLLWTAGSPAGLAWDATDRYGALRVSGAGEDGGFRRPLDPEGVGVAQLAALRWQPLGGRGSLIGRVVADRASAERSPFTPALSRYDADPFVVTDTIEPETVHVRARLEGGYGGAWGPWALGLMAGLQVGDDRTTGSRLPRFGRESVPGLSAGVARRIGESLALSVYGRWTGGTEALRLVAVPAVEGVVYPLQGYSEPEPARFSGRVYTRFVERDAYEGGAAAAGRAGRLTWAAFGEGVRNEHRHTQRRRADDPVDRWEASGWRTGAAAASTLLEDRLHTAVSMTYEALAGDAYRADLQGTIFRVDETTLDASAQVRWAPFGASWHAGAAAEIRRDSRTADDFLAETGSVITTWTPALGLEVSRRLGHGTFVSLGAGAARRSAVSRLPLPEALGPIYARVIGPAVAVDAAPKDVVKASAAFRWQAVPTLGLLLEGGVTRLVRAGDEVVPLVPEGSRTVWRLSLGGVWEGASGLAF